MAVSTAYLEREYNLTVRLVDMKLRVMAVNGLTLMCDGFSKADRFVRVKYGELVATGFCRCFMNFVVGHRHERSF